MLSVMQSKSPINYIFILSTGWNSHCTKLYKTQTKIFVLSSQQTSPQSYSSRQNLEGHLSAILRHTEHSLLVGIPGIPLNDSVSWPIQNSVKPLKLNAGQCFISNAKSHLMESTLKLY